MKHKKQLRKGSDTGTTKSSSKSCGSVSSSGNGTDSEDRKGNNSSTMRLDNGKNEYYNS